MPVLCQHLSHNDREDLRLSNMLYLDGECYAFAIALHRLTSWTIVGLMQGDVPFHAAVRDDRNRLRDFRGVVPHAKFGPHFGMYPPYDLRDLVPDDLLRVRPVSEHSIATALTLAEAIWPDLPQPPWCRRARAVRFAEALERVCHEHGMWFTAPIPGTHGWPFLTFDDDDRQGIELRPAITGNSFYVNSHFEKPS